MSDVPEWESVPQPDGHEWEIRRAPIPDATIAHEPSVFGTVRVTDHGWIAHAIDGRSYGPFTSLGEAAYPLALLADGHDAHLLLGDPLRTPGSPPVRTPGSAPVPAPALPQLPPPSNEKRNRRLLTAALLALTVVAIVAERRGSRS